MGSTPMQRRILTILLLLGVFLCVTGLRWLEEDYLLHGFEEVALKAEYEKGKSQPLRK
ncbi:hypothetical protein [Solemya velesiana gill symbiont]|uniref:hypothetical protein n=1 Tax=Solemya velesiana gill symbiont TaxID=1918948 RepID=UPI00155FD385|nr:hypothetical protein [Solemya velesiana gill symbiont]